MLIALVTSLSVNIFNVLVKGQINCFNLPLTSTHCPPAMAGSVVQYMYYSHFGSQIKLKIEKTNCSIFSTLKQRNQSPQSTSKYSAIRVFIGLADLHISFPLLHYNRLSFSSLGTVVMITPEDLQYIAMCLEWFLFGKLSVLCALAFTLDISC